MLTAAFWKGAAERAIKTAAQAFVAGVGTSTLIEQVSWKVVLSATVMAAILSLVTSIGNSDFVAGTPVVVTTDDVAPSGVIEKSPYDGDEVTVTSDGGADLYSPEHAVQADATDEQGHPATA